MSRDYYLLLWDLTADTENTASSIVACWFVFTELLPGNALIKSVTLLKLSLKIERKISSFFIQTSILLTSTAFSRIHFQSYILSNDAKRPMFNAISHE
jgi:hypothetical protein